MTAHDSPKLVIFRTRSQSRLVYVEATARILLQLMGREDAVPGGMRPEDLPTALRRLQAIHQAGGNESRPAAKAADDGAGTDSLNWSAGPLIQLLRAANDRRHHVVWDYCPGDG